MKKNTTRMPANCTEISEEMAFANGTFWCVSTSSGGYMSLSWNEHFFLNEEEAKVYRDFAKQKGLAVLIVNQDGY